MFPRSYERSNFQTRRGDLSAERLLYAYQHGIFPWPLDENAPIAWWSPDPRAIIELDEFHVSRRLRQTLRSGRFQITCDQDFTGVIRGCATAGDRVGQTWIMPAMPIPLFFPPRFSSLPQPMDRASALGRPEGAIEHR